MKLSEINNWFSLIANIGVLAGLVFLGLEMQQNTRMAERELAVSQSDNIHGQIVESEFLSNILTKIDAVQGEPRLVTEYIEKYGMTAEESRRWWRYIFQIWTYNQAEWIYNGRPPNNCEVNQLRFVDHQLFYEHMKVALDEEYVKCIDTWYVDSSDSGT